MKVELWKISDITPYPGNPRQNDAAVDAVAASIKEFGFRQPIVVDEQGVIVVGHTRFKAALKLGLQKVPVHVARGLTPAQVKAYRLADNKTADLATWDFDLLPIELADLQGMDFDLSMLGFSEDELAQLLDPGVKEGLTDPDEVPEPPDEATTQPGDLWVLGDHRLLCGDSGNAEHVDRLLAGAAIHLVNTDPPYNVRVEPRSNNAIAAGNSSFTNYHHQQLDLARHPEKSRPTHRKMRAKDRPLANDFVSEADFDRMLHAWFGNMARVLESGRGFYIWGGYANCGNYPPVLKASSLYFSQAIIWDKQHPVLTRKDFMGAHEWCQPGETKVETPDGPVPISSLRDGDRVVSYSRSHHALIGLRNGFSIRSTSRQYRGDLLGVNVAGRTTWCTPGHLWSSKLSAAAATWWCVYLMRRGRWWRVGKSKLLSTWGFGVKHRLKCEGGEEAWILSVHPSNVDATLAEQIILAEYGIPTTTWSESAASRRCLADIRQLYERLDLDRMHQNALRALSDHGRWLEYPFMTAVQTRPKVGRRTSSLVRACNLLAGVMMVPVPRSGQQATWELVQSADRQPFDGPVYSMEVDRFGHYVADGLVTHNCFYGWKEGAAHHFFGPNNVPDLWHVKKINPNKMVHLTEKPVELAVRAMEYSSRAGENVLDLFGGSGSTLIAAEQTGRKAFLMELDALYADVIVQRWENFTGKKAQREGDVTPGEPVEVSS
jgi:DNA modification methylase